MANPYTARLLYLVLLPEQQLWEAMDVTCDKRLSIL
jgi:hypothetical protein